MGWGSPLALAIPLAGLLWAGGGVPRWQGSVLLHLLGVAGLAGAGVSFLARAGAPGLRAGVPLAGSPDPPGRVAAGAGTALLLFLGILLASAALAEHPVVAFRVFGAWLCLAGWGYLAARRAGTAERLRGQVAWLGAFGALACAISLLDSLNRHAAVPRLPLDSPNLNGALAAAAFPVLAALAAVESARGRRAAWGLAAALAAAAALSSRSTGAVLALVAGSGTLAAGWLAARRPRRGRWVAGSIAAALVLASLAGPILLGRGTLAEREGKIGVTRTEGPSDLDPRAKDRPAVHWLRLRAFLRGHPDAAVAGRVRFARATLGALREGPLLGFGSGSVPLTFARHRLQVPGASRWGEAVGQLHSVGLQRLYESGLAGLLAFAGWVVVSLLGGPPAEGLLLRLRIALASSVAALAVAGGADALETAPALAAAGVMTVALLAARSEGRAAERLPRRAHAAFGLLILALALAAGADFLRADAAQRRAERASRRAAAAGFDASVLEDLRASARLDGSVGLYGHQAAYAAEELALDLEAAGDASGARALFEEAERLHRRAARRFADVPGFASQAGNFLLDRDRAKEAIPYLLKGAALDYYDPLGQFYLGEAFRLSGRESEAIEAHARAIRYYPRMATAALWRAPEARGLYRRVLERMRDLLIEESARPDPGSPAGRLLQWVDREIEAAGRERAPAGRRTILVHRFDRIPDTSRARHLFARSGFTIENLPVTIEGEEADGARWAHILDGLPAVTAAEIEVGMASAAGLPRPVGGSGARPARRRAPAQRVFRGGEETPPGCGERGRRG